MNGRAGELRISLTALLLAGGESRRMGEDKATMKFRGQPMWQRQMETLRALGAAKVFVSVRSKPDWLPDDVKWLMDDVPSRGPMSGIAKALAMMETSHLLVLAIDMPFMTTAELEGLSNLVLPGCGVVPVTGERAEPLAAVYPREAVEEFETALAGRDFSLQSVVRKLAKAGKITLSSVPRASADLYRNLNEPADLKEGRF